MFRLSCSLALVLAVLPVTGLAQTPAESRSATELDAVIVTAQKREQALKDVPLAISALDGDVVKRQAFTDFERLSTRIPGFFVQQQTDSSASFVMRGIEAGSADAASEPSISFFLNEVDTSPYTQAAQNLYDPPQRRRQTGVTLLADWQPAGAWSARSISAWREVKFSEAWDIDGTSYHFLIGRNLEDDQKIISQELRMAYDDGGRFRSTFGISYYNDKTWNLFEVTINEQYLLAGFPNSTTPVTHIPVGGVLTPVTEGVATLLSTRNHRDSWSAYVNLGYDLTPRWVLDTGVRYTRDDATLFNFRSVSTVDGIAPIALTNGLGSSQGQEFSNHRRYSLVQPRLALTWRASDEVNLYTGISRGLRSGYPRTDFAAPINGLPQPYIRGK